ncbi:M64 family metallopeptidase [uncultured Bacteroides sp.]|uniref:M64 family metallopeptidase n=1 Tax=uncultured Bacteroides sp. TaxID=162156 RepID=UPI002604054E|nr:M64 family metallopeptidase [uncultured Bacteroides sp.]
MKRISTASSVLEELLGEGDKPYESTDFSADKKVVVVQKATKGKGINMVLLGDGFSDRLIADGTYESVMMKGIEAFFNIQPYTYFRDYFNIYYVNAVSVQEGCGRGMNTVFTTVFGDGTSVEGNNYTCMDYARLCGFTDDEMNEVLIITMMNSTRYAGTCVMFRGPHYLGDYGRGMSISYFPIGNNDKDLEQVLHHEAGGHGFSKLLDEYYYDKAIYQGDIDTYLMLRESYGWGKNVDYVSSPTEVYWSKFITDPRYKQENIGVYEGAATYMYGAYRPTDYSIMRYNTGGFNAPSREAIYYRIHKLAYGEEWEYDFEEFVKWDQVYGMPSFTGSTVSRSIDPEKRTAPPVIIDGYWANGRLILE